jgi:hypothetical protein
MGDLALKAISDHPRTYLEGTYRNLRRHLTAVGAAGESPGLADTEGLAKSDLEQTGSKLPVALTKAAWAGGETLTRVWWVLSLNALAGLLLLLGPTRETRRAASAFVAVWLVVAAATSMTNAVEPRFALQVAAITYLLGAAGAALAACAVMTRLSANWSAPPRRDTEKPSDL